MTKGQQLDLFDTTFSKLKDILTKKGSDYANSDNIMANFIDVAAIVNILKIDTGTARGQVLEMIVRKLHRICNLVAQGKTPENESLLDNEDDLLGYGFLLKCVELDLF